MDIREQSSAQTGAERREPLDSRNLWLLGLAVEADGTIVGPGLRRFSFWADCECPDDCNRDHENE